MPVDAVIWSFWGMRLHHPFSDGDSRRNQSMKGLGRVVIGSAVGGLVGAAAFFAADGLIPVQAHGEAKLSEQNLSDSECFLKWEKAQYTNNPKNIKAANHLRYFVNDDNSVSQIQKLGKRCVQKDFGSIDTERALLKPAATGAKAVKVMLKLESNQLIMYEKNFDNLFDKRIFPIKLGTLRK